MARFTRKQTESSNPPSAPASQGEGAFAWSFGPEEGTGPVIEHEPRGASLQRDAALRARFQGVEGRKRTAALARELDAAQDRWWSRGDLPDQLLLRDGLLALEAGHILSEGHGTLLLRAALAQGRGMITALAHQSDPERTADVLADALLDPRPRRSGGSLPVDTVRRLRQEDAQGAAWGARLLQILRTETTLPLEPRRSHAVRVLAQIQARPAAPLASQPTRAYPAVPAADPSLQQRRSSRLWGGIFALLAVILLGAAATLAWQGFPTQAAHDQVVVPAGTYSISDPSQPGQDRLVQVQAFRLDRTEVTNADYRLCREAGVCPLPSGTSLGGGNSASPPPIMDPAKQDHPVVGVTWGSANAYCTWAEKRLPLEEEWEVVASVAPTTLRAYTFPWGDQFRAGVVNGLGVGDGGPLPVGSFSPNGDSQFGAADMAGNVAEWTATLLEAGVFVVKGGSFQDDPSGLRTDSWQAIPAETTAPWLGFRCAVTGP